MSHYFIARIKVNDQLEYEKYLEGFDEIFSRYKGEYLSIDEIRFSLREVGITLNLS